MLARAPLRRAKKMQSGIPGLKLVICTLLCYKVAPIFPYRVNMKHHEKLDLPHAVYRFFDSAGILLYVGCSTNPFGGRFAAHGATKPWAKDIALATIEWFPGWEAGLQAEAKAVLAERPKYNLATPAPENVGRAVFRQTIRRKKGDGYTCPRCGKPKENPRPGKAYCNHCYAEYKRTRRLQQIAS